MLSNTLRALAVATLGAALLVGCGDTTSDNKTKSKASNTQNTDNNNNNNNNNTVETKRDWCTTICNKDLGCMGEVCTGTSDLQECIDGCFDDPNVTVDTRDAYVDAACEALVRVNCTSEAIREACTCPAVGDCPEGQQCVPLQDGSGACAAGQSAPAGAAECSQTVACPNDTDVCVLFASDATSGFCLIGC